MLRCYASFTCIHIPPTPRTVDCGPLRGFSRLFAVNSDEKEFFGPLPLKSPMSGKCRKPRQPLPTAFNRFQPPTFFVSTPRPGSYRQLSAPEKFFPNQLLLFQPAAPEFSFRSLPGCIVDLAIYDAAALESRGTPACYTPMSSFQSSGLAAIKSRIIWMQVGSWRTSTWTPWERTYSSGPLKVTFSPIMTFGIL